MKVIRLGGEGDEPPRRPRLPGGSGHPPRDAPPSAARTERSVHPAYYFLVSLLFSLILFALFFVSDHGLLQVKKQRQQLARLQGEVAALWGENERLEGEIAALKSDPVAVERIAREDLGFARADEVVVRLPKGWRERVAPTRPPAR